VPFHRKKLADFGIGTGAVIGIGAGFVEKGEEVTEFR
jgi:hypothetical protein